MRSYIYSSTLDVDFVSGGMAEVKFILRKALENLDAVGLLEHYDSYITSEFCFTMKDLRNRLREGDMLLPANLKSEIIALIDAENTLDDRIKRLAEVPHFTLQLFDDNAHDNTHDTTSSSIVPIMTTTEYVDGDRFNFSARGHALPLRSPERSSKPAPSGRHIKHNYDCHITSPCLVHRKDKSACASPCGGGASLAAHRSPSRPDISLRTCSDTPPCRKSPLLIAATRSAQIDDRARRVLLFEDAMLGEGARSGGHYHSRDSLVADIPPTQKCTKRKTKKKVSTFHLNLCEVVPMMEAQSSPLHPSRSSELPRTLSGPQNDSDARRSRTTAGISGLDADRRWEGGASGERFVIASREGGEGRARGGEAAPIPYTWLGASGEAVAFGHVHLEHMRGEIGIAPSGEDRRQHATDQSVSVSSNDGQMSGDASPAPVETTTVRSDADPSDAPDHWSGHEGASPWEVYLSEEGYPYHYNAVTEESTWTCPLGLFLSTSESAQEEYPPCECTERYFAACMGASDAQSDATVEYNDPNRAPADPISDADIDSGGDSEAVDVCHVERCEDTDGQSARLLVSTSAVSPTPTREVAVVTEPITFDMDRIEALLAKHTSEFTAIVPTGITRTCGGAGQVVASTPLRHEDLSPARPLPLGCAGSGVEVPSNDATTVAATDPIEYDAGSVAALIEEHSVTMASQDASTGATSSRGSTGSRNKLKKGKGENGEGASTAVPRIWTLDLYAMAGEEGEGEDIVDGTAASQLGGAQSGEVTHSKHADSFSDTLHITNPLESATPSIVSNCTPSLIEAAADGERIVLETPKTKKRNAGPVNSIKDIQLAFIPENWRPQLSATAASPERPQERVRKHTEMGPRDAETGKVTAGAPLPIPGTDESPAVVSSRVSEATSISHPSQTSASSRLARDSLSATAILAKQRAFMAAKRKAEEARRVKPGTRSPATPCFNDWVVYETDDGYPYHYNVITDESTWICPLGLFVDTSVDEVSEEVYRECQCVVNFRATVNQFEEHQTNVSSLSSDSFEGQERADGRGGEGRNARTSNAQDSQYDVPFVRTSSRDYEKRAVVPEMPIAKEFGSFASLQSPSRSARLRSKAKAVLTSAFPFMKNKKVGGEVVYM